MEEWVHRIGIRLFVQIIIECWNTVFLLIMILSILLGKYRDKMHIEMSKVKIPMIDDVIIFYIAIFMYNLFDIFFCAYTGVVSSIGYYIRSITSLVYYIVGAFLTLFFLQIIKNHIAVKNELHKLKNIIFAFQLLQIPGLVLLAATPFTGMLYYFDSQNYYHRGPLYGVWYYITLISFIFIIVVYMACRKKIDRFPGQVIIVASVIPLIAFICNYVYIGISFNNISVSITALIIFLLYEKQRTDVLVLNACELEKAQIHLVESRLALEHSKNETLMAQIQPHFINNSLMALRYQCFDYPEIYENLTNFSRYLRSHFEALGDTRLIMFEQEMENIEAYLALEKCNFGDRLRIEYDIDCDDFLIPALSVQPLVENAVRHGVATYEKGGTVQINTHRADGEIIIEVIDKGFGKSNITPQQETRKGIGVENVRARLKSMSRGKLKIVGNEQGTTARITIDDIGKVGGL